MRVLLVNPPSSNLYGELGSRLPPLGLAYVAGVVRERGHTVEIADLDADPSAGAHIDVGAFDVVGITSDTPGYPRAIEIARAAHREGHTVVMGGYHATFLDEEALSTGCVDYVVRGEGEESFSNLLDALDGGCPVEEVRGLSFRKGGRTIRTPDARPMVDLDRLPLPARDLLPMEKYRGFLSGQRATSLITSRGCPFNCFFCASSAFGGLRWRTRRVEAIVDEIEAIHAGYGYRAFLFMDDNFTLQPRRVLAFADEIERRGLDIRWWCFSRADTIATHERMVQRMAEAGATQVFLGLESGSQESLDDYGKRMTVEQQEEAIAMLRRYGIRVHGSFILGGLRETRERIEQTIDTAIRLDPYIVQFSVLTPYPGTALFKQAQREGRLVTYNWALYDGTHAVLRGDFLDPWTVQQLFLRAYSAFYFRGTRIFQTIANLVRRRERLGVLLREIRLALQVGDQLKKDAGKATAVVYRAAE